jgi:hypothetical protein
MVLAARPVVPRPTIVPVGAAFFVLHEDERGRDPAVTQAKGLVASCRRAARGSASVPPAAKCALALKNTAAGSRPAEAAARPPGSVTGPAVVGREDGGAGRVTAAAPIAGLPHRPRAPWPTLPAPVASAGATR